MPLQLLQWCVSKIIALRRYVSLPKTSRAPRVSGANSIGNTSGGQKEETNEDATYGLDSFCSNSMKLRGSVQRIQRAKGLHCPSGRRSCGEQIRTFYKNIFFYKYEQSVVPNVPSFSDVSDSPNFSHLTMRVPIFLDYFQTSETHGRATRARGVVRRNGVSTLPCTRRVAGSAPCANSS